MIIHRFTSALPSSYSFIIDREGDGIVYEHVFFCDYVCLKIACNGTHRETRSIRNDGLHPMSSNSPFKFRVLIRKNRYTIISNRRRRTKEDGILFTDKSYLSNFDSIIETHPLGGLFEAKLRENNSFAT